MEQDKTESLQGAQNGKGADIFNACDQEEEADTQVMRVELHTHAHARQDANGLKETRRSEIEGARPWGKREGQLQPANAILRKGWAGIEACVESFIPAPGHHSPPACLFGNGSCCKLRAGATHGSSASAGISI